MGPHVWMRVRIRAAAVALVALAGVPSPASAGSQADAEAEFLGGVAHFKTGEVPKAIAAFEKALALDAHPTLLFNLAVLNDRAGKSKRAAGYYRRYLDTDPTDSGYIMERFRQVAPKQAEAYARERDTKDSPKDDQPKEPKGGGRKPDHVARQGSDGRTVTPGRASPPVISYVLLGAGVLGLGAGGAFGLLTATDVDGFVAAVVNEDKAGAEEHAESARSHQLLANAAYAVGGAAIAAGLLLVLLGGDDDTGAGAGPSGKKKKGAAASVVPLVGPDTSGATFQLTF